MRRLVLALAAASLFGCGDSSGPGFSSAVGTWNLIEIDDQGLPYTLVQIGPNYRLELISQRIVVDEDGTWSGMVTIRETDNGTITTTQEPGTGTWSQADASVTITDSDGFTSTALISGNTIRYEEDGIESVFRRE